MECSRYSCLHHIVCKHPDSFMPHTMGSPSTLLGDVVSSEITVHAATVHAAKGEGQKALAKALA